MADWNRELFVFRAFEIYVRVNITQIYRSCLTKHTRRFQCKYQQINGAEGNCYCLCEN